MEWKSINLETGQVYISKLVSKTGDDREVPVFENAKAWLLTCAKNGALCPKSSFNRRLLTLQESVGIQTWRQEGEAWGHDTLRHTFGSFWLPIYKNRPLLAEIMGNSFPVIPKHSKRTLSVAQTEALFRSCLRAHNSGSGGSEVSVFSHRIIHPPALATAAPPPLPAQPEGAAPAHGAEPVVYEPELRQLPVIGSGSGIFKQHNFRHAE